MRNALHRRAIRAPTAVTLLLAVLTSAFTHTALAAAAAPSIDTTIEPAQISLGDSAQLTIMTSGSGSLSVNLPVVAGLEFRVVGQSRRIEMINGATIESTSTIIRVTPDEVGVFTIPGLSPHSPPLVLKVLQAGGSGPSLTPSNPGSAALNSFLRGGSEANGIRLSPDGSAYIRLEVPKREIYVGESVPAEIQVGMRNGFAASNSLPTLNTSDFTLNNLSLKPDQSGKAIDGKPFTVFTWHTLLAAIKPGTYSVSFSAPFVVRIRSQPRSDSIIDDLLGDPFMQNLFGASVSKNITVASPETEFTVLPLPAQGRPADFGGAVGAFKITTDVSSTSNIAGDPLTLRMHVTGIGNFDRVESNMLTGDPQWKTYQPKATFNKTDTAGYHGEKIFEQPLIASQAGEQTIPALSFSYFDPAARRYETVHSAPLRVRVAPSAADSAATLPPALASHAYVPAANSTNGYRPDHTVTEARANSLVPLYLRPAFLSIQSALAVFFAAAWAVLRRHERNARDMWLQRERLRQEALQGSQKQMAAAAAAGKAAEFFSAARTALQLALSPLLHKEPEHIMAADIDTRAGSDSEAIRKLFAYADEANYSGSAPGAVDFERWTRVVSRRMTAEKAS